MRVGLTPALLGLLACADGDDKDGFAPAQTDDSVLDTGPFDEDGDGHFAASDCDDQDPDVHPDAEEVWYDGVDNDCDPSTRDDDFDDDGFPRAEDCDDHDASRSPDALDLPCDGLDQDCSGVADDVGSTVVLGVSPRAALPAGAPLIIELDGAPEALLEDNVILIGELSGRVRGSLSSAGADLSFQPERALAPGERLHLTVLPFPSEGGGRSCRPHTSQRRVATAAADPGSASAAVEETMGEPVDALLAFDGAAAAWPRALIQSAGHVRRAEQGALTSDASLSLPEGARIMGLADLNLDGAPELLAMSADAVHVAAGEAGWVSATWTRYEIDYAELVDLSPGDLDGDGDLDIAVAAKGALGGDDRVHVLYNDGTGALVPAVRGVETFADPYALVTGDLDGDGDLDIAVAVQGPGLDTLVNDGDANFSLDLTLSTSSRLVDLDTADMDLDGDAELVAAAADADQAWVIVNDGASLNTRAQVPLGLTPQTCALVDLDGDGHLDVLASGAQQTALIEARSDGSYALWGTLSGGLGLPLDHDGDGALEALTADGARLTLWDWN